MANSVDLVIGSEAIKQVESLISKLSLADAELLKISLPNQRYDSDEFNVLFNSLPWEYGGRI